MEYFPHEILVSVFQILPVKSLTRFRSLSKECDSTISNSNFIQNHLKIMKSKQDDHQDFILPQYPHGPSFGVLRFNPSDFDHGGLDSVELLEVPQPPEMMGKIDGSPVVECDGMLCMHDSNMNIVVWNPSTKVHKIHPHHPISHSIHNLGFGYVSVNDDYKVVIMCTISSSSILTLFTLRLKTGTWSDIVEDKLSFSYHPAFKPTKTIEECIYWLGYNNNVCFSIACFDLEQEKLREVALPDTSKVLDGKRNDCLLGNLNKSLCLTSFDRYCGEDSYYDVWVMDNTTKCWKNLFKFPTFSRPSRCSIFSMYYGSNGCVLTNELCKRNKRRRRQNLFLYHNPKDGSVPVKEIEVKGINDDSSFFSMIPYVESLVSPKFR